VVLGDDALEVRTAAWILSSVLEATHGTGKSATISSRRTQVGWEAVDVGLALTPCVVQELLADMVASGVEECIAEALPGAQSADAFSGVQFEYAVDVGGFSDGIAHPAPLDCREELLGQTRPGGIVAPGQREATGAPRWYYLEEPPVETSSGSSAFKAADELDLQHAFAKLGVPGKRSLESMLGRCLGFTPRASYASSAAEGAPEPKRRGIRRKTAAAPEQPAGAPERGEPQLTDAAPAGEVAAGGPPSEEISPPAMLPLGVLHGQVLLETRAGSMKLALGLKDCGPVTLNLPLVGITGARGALAAACSALAMHCDGTAELGDLEWLRANLESVPPPPGTLEVMTAGTPPKAVAILHEAATPHEVKHALEVVRTWLSFGSQDAASRPSLTAVLGCRGEERRGDRAKCGWALSEFCDRIVLTSDQPRGEPPMQIMEDILEAIRSRAPRETSRLCARLQAREVHIVADRADAVKLAVCSSIRAPATDTEDAGPPGVVVLFGSSHGDTQEAADADGHIRQWLFSDRRILLEALESAEHISGLSAGEGGEAEGAPANLDISQVPWNFSEKPARNKTAMTLPGQSLHWTHCVSVCSDGSIRKPL